ncbi:MAG: glycosyltransferase family 4 protein [Colwellia sp.]|uniref:glycosyltransferase family 4 protein n=1 Tax=Alteromonadales TaxID=135622 RepID=UPI001D51E85E|nr:MULTISPECIES: glycosyltransferase family 4 protein [Alteromonadales]NQZ26985.1 glycosyltransferase family 4 protein [Colwellia sp.]NRA78642.1 glycosyltransferase family 4 protein [Pseudoalteromonas sp.]
MIRFNIVSASDLADPNGVSKFIHNFITNIDSSDVSLSRVYARYKKRVISVEPSEYKDLIDKVEDAGHNSRKEKIKVNNKIKSFILGNSLFSLLYLFYAIIWDILKISVSIKRKFESGKDVYVFQDFITLSFSSLINSKTKNILVLHCSDEPLSQYYINSPGLKSFIGTRFLNWLFQNSVRHSEYVVTLGEDIAKKLNVKFNTNKFISIPNGVPKVQCCFSDKSLFKDSAILKICSVGSVTKRKGHDILIKALVILSNEGYKNIECDIFGPGNADFIHKLDDLVRVNKLNVSFKGSVVEPLSREHFDLFILPSRNEGLPLSIIEAASIALPIISTDVGSIKEVFGSSLIYVLPEPKSVASAISSIMQDNEILNDYSLKVSTLYEETLSFKIMQDKYITLIKKV